MIMEALQFLVELGAEKTKEIFEGDGVEHHLINGKLEELDRPLPNRSHTFRTLDGFIDYLQSDHAKKTTINTDDDERGKDVVFVGSDSIRAQLLYQESTANEHRLNLNLEESEEFLALRKLFDGVSQKDLWRMLVTDLTGCINNSLLLAIGQLDVTEKNVQQTRIDTSGIEQREGSNGITILYPAQNGEGELIAPLKVDWDWTGRIWECFNQEAVVHLRLEIELEKNGLKFKFHPSRLELVMSGQRADIVETLRERLPKEQFDVFEGVY